MFLYFYDEGFIAGYNTEAYDMSPCITHPWLLKCNQFNMNSFDGLQIQFYNGWEMETDQDGSFYLVYTWGTGEGKKTLYMQHDINSETGMMHDTKMSETPFVFNNINSTIETKQNGFILQPKINGPANYFHFVFSISNEENVLSNKVCLTETSNL
jgi:hypothetical protein